MFDGRRYAPFTISNPIAICVLLLIATPVGEELVFRGLVEGYLITVGASLPITVLIPAILFASIHLLTYHFAPREKPPASYTASILLAVLAIGILTSYYRAVTRSIILPILLHSVAKPQRCNKLQALL